MNNSLDNEMFVNDYIAAWSTTDSEIRKMLVSKVYSDNATFYAAEPNDEPVTFHGVEKIVANITHVNERDVQGRGLTIQRKQFDINHDAVKVSWQMLSSDAKVALAGMSLLLRDKSGKILHDYIFIG